jgi:hypothetical protein
VAKVAAPVAITLQLDSCAQVRLQPSGQVLAGSKAYLLPLYYSSGGDARHLAAKNARIRVAASKPTTIHFSHLQGKRGCVLDSVTGTQVKDSPQNAFELCLIVSAIPEKEQNRPNLRPRRRRGLPYLPRQMAQQQGSPTPRGAPRSANSYIIFHTKTI